MQQLGSVTMPSCSEHKPAGPSAPAAAPPTANTPRNATPGQTQGLSVDHRSQGQEGLKQEQEQGSEGCVLPAAGTPVNLGAQRSSVVKLSPGEVHVVRSGVHSSMAMVASPSHQCTGRADAAKVAAGALAGGSGSGSSSMGGGPGATSNDKTLAKAMPGQQQGQQGWPAQGSKPEVLSGTGANASMATMQQFMSHQFALADCMAAHASMLQAQVSCEMAQLARTGSLGLPGLGLVQHASLPSSMQGSLHDSMQGAGSVPLPSMQPMHGLQPGTLPRVSSLPAKVLEPPPTAKPASDQGHVTGVRQELDSQPDHLQAHAGRQVQHMVTAPTQQQQPQGFAQAQVTQKQQSCAAAQAQPQQQHQPQQQMSLQQQVAQATHHQQGGAANHCMDLSFGCTDSLQQLHQTAPTATTHARDCGPCDTEVTVHGFGALLGSTMGSASGSHVHGQHGSSCTAYGLPPGHLNSTHQYQLPDLMLTSDLPDLGLDLDLEFECGGPLPFPTSPPELTTATTFGSTSSWHDGSSWGHIATVSSSCVNPLPTGLLGRQEASAAAGVASAANLYPSGMGSVGGGAGSLAHIPVPPAISGLSVGAAWNHGPGLHQCTPSGAGPQAPDSHAHAHQGSGSQLSQGCVAGMSDGCSGLVGYLSLLPARQQSLPTAMLAAPTTNRMEALLYRSRSMQHHNVNSTQQAG